MSLGGRQQQASLPLLAVLVLALVSWAAATAPPPTTARGPLAPQWAGRLRRTVGSGVARVLPAARTSPFQPRSPPSWPKSKPFFEGWFIRVVDHVGKASFCVILGSFKHARQRGDDAVQLGNDFSGFSSHYLGLSYHVAAAGKDEATTLHHFASPEDVSIAARTPSRPGSCDPPDPDFSIEFKDAGSFQVSPEGGSLNFTVPGLSVHADFNDRKPWSRGKPNSKGPEGWLPGWLLPCHYFVHTLASPASYCLDADGLPDALEGKGVLHAECNYGDVFPAGWCWAQGCNSGGTASFILTGGKFVIGPVVTSSWVLGYRSSQLDWNFRTTDFDRVVASANCDDGRLSLRCTSRCGRRLMTIDIQAPQGSFGEPIYCPTQVGWSNLPGCIESYTATARLRCFRRTGWRLRKKLVEDVQVPLAALEFGGDFQGRQDGTLEL
jgi:hypothetical protein